MSIEKYQKWRDHKGRLFTPVSVDGLDLISDRNLNKGTAFTMEEREEFHLRGLIPPNVQTLEDQKVRVYEGFCAAPSDIDKYIYLRSLQDRNETLFYSLIEEHIEEMLPIIYIPTVVTACSQFSHHYQRARGLYITKDNVEKLPDMTNHFASSNIEMIVVTDSQGISGMHDIGVGGMAIPIGKLSLYTLGSGLHPSYCLPIAIDIGTDNEELLADPLYLGVGHKRIKGEKYDKFLDKFVEIVRQSFPKAILQWEDFAKHRAFQILEKYRDKLPSFNDDIQGTGAVVMAGVLNAVKTKNEDLKDQKFVIFGAGSGGIGFARQLVLELEAMGISKDEARQKICLFDSKGCILQNRPDLEDYKKPFAMNPSQLANVDASTGKPSLLDVIKSLKATFLIGISGQKDVFTEEHVKAMMENTERPVIFPLTNPASECEASPEDLCNWTDGKAIVALGSAWGEIEHGGKCLRVGVASNAFVFPGVGMASMISRQQVLTDDMFTNAAHALASCVSEKDLSDGAVYPRLKDIQKVGLRVATEILRGLIKSNPDLGIKEENLYDLVQSKVWKPMYHPYRRV
ncbi:MAG: NAD-dependent malic enzyme [Proteobacteria bacterium]|nr:NAD-dependent malic enzyme [Pseudomonadota bacterium]